MLRKMHLVPADQLDKHRQISPPAKKPKRPPATKSKRPKLQRRQHTYDKWVKVRGKIREAELEREAK